VSVCSDEGLDVSQQFAETVFSGSSLDSDAEEIVSGENIHRCLFLICYHQSDSMDLYDKMQQTHSMELNSL